MTRITPGTLITLPHGTTVESPPPKFDCADLAVAADFLSEHGFESAVTLLRWFAAMGETCLVEEFVVGTNHGPIPVRGVLSRIEREDFGTATLSFVGEGVVPVSPFELMREHGEGK